MFQKKLSYKLENFPIMMFAIVMGISGLTIVYQKAALWVGFSHIFANLLAILDSFLFFTIAFIYTTKIIKHTQAVKAELAHTIRINFFATFSISLLLLSAIYGDFGFGFAGYFWFLGVVFQTFFTFYTMKFWIQNNIEITSSNPAWFIPIVGNVIVPVGGVGIVSNQVLMYFFSIGIFFWIIILAIIFNRILFHNQLAQKFMPTLFILIAPPAIGLVSYVKMTENFDFFASFLYNIGLFFTFLLLFMWKSFVKLKFFISWWAFTFPLAAITIATLLIYHKTSIGFYANLGFIFMFITTVVVCIVAFATLKHIFRGEICIAEH